jgi:hypothetical protein
MRTCSSRPRFLSSPASTLASTLHRLLAAAAAASNFVTTALTLHPADYSSLSPLLLLLQPQSRCILSRSLLTGTAQGTGQCRYPPARIPFHRQPQCQQRLRFLQTDQQQTAAGARLPVRNSLRAGLRGNCTTIRNGAEVADAHAKEISKHYTNKSTGKDCDLNVKLRSFNLSGSGVKAARCMRLALHLQQGDKPLELAF